jgi:hypothetical protein
MEYGAQRVLEEGERVLCSRMGGGEQSEWVGASFFGNIPCNRSMYCT